MILFSNIKAIGGITGPELRKKCGKEMSEFLSLEDAWLLTDGAIIHSTGSMAALDATITAHGNRITKNVNCEGRYLLPSWCDSHTHIVYAGSRESEFSDRIHGMTYEQIYERGGGILNSAAKLRGASEEALTEAASGRLQEIMRQGTGAVEIKSGYGLDLESELKMLRVIRRLKEASPIAIRSTFLGAHALPAEFKQDKKSYIRLITEAMMPAIAEEQLADYCDVFCEQQYFTPEETIEILEKGKSYGMVPKVHAEQMSNYGGVLAGVKAGAISVDHLEYVGDKEIDALLQSHTMPTVLPGAAFFLGLPLPPARKMIDAGLPVALASDYNPGSSPTGNMNLMVSLGCIQYKMTPEEAFNAATINSAYAMDLSSSHGSICPGKTASFFITEKIPSLAFLPYAFGRTHIETIVLNGIIQ